MKKAKSENKTFVYVEKDWIKWRRTTINEHLFILQTTCLFLIYKIVIGIHVKSRNSVNMYKDV